MKDDSIVCRNDLGKSRGGELLMKITELNMPKVPTDTGRIFDLTEPIIRLEQMAAAEYERIVGEWAYSYLKESREYYDVVLMGGSSDSGRDLVAYLDDTYSRYDIYQCKHYENPLKPSEYWIELGKLCYYTYMKEYRIPEKYYIVASKGIGVKFRKYIENPTTIGTELIKQWDTYCGGKNRILAEGIPLTNELKSYIEQFDFTIIKDISPIKFLDQFSQTSWYKYHFGGGIKKRPVVDKPDEILSKEEKKLPYVKQLLEVYSEEDSFRYEDDKALKRNPIFFNHFSRQREGFYSAQSLKRFVRDELVDEGEYEALKEQVSFGIADTYEKIYESKLARVKSTTEKATELNLSSTEIHDIKIQDKNGMCHELVNDGKLMWSNDNGNL